MSYLVLARKWRPLTFDDVIGQEHITRTLKKAIEKGRVAHAYVFSGTRGTGKTTTARILARALNCEKGPTPDPCGVCDACKNIMAGSSFDVLEIDGASNNKVDDIRDLRDNVNYSSMGGKFRVFVIDEVHMLSKAAFNALLKTLEEPPKDVIFIFATTEPNKIPETIHSRCQRYDFRRISTEQILDRLIRICDAEKVAYERAGLLLVARKAEGSMRDGLSILDQVYSFCNESIGEKDVRSVLGLVDVEVYKKIMDAVARRDPEPVLGAVQDILYQGNDLHEFLIGLEEHLRTLLFARFPGIFDNKRIDLHVDSPEIAAVYKSQAANFSEGTLVRMTEVVRKAEQDLKWSSFPRFLVEVMLLKLVYMDSTVSVEELLTAFKQTGRLPPVDSGAAAAPEADRQKKKELTSAVADDSARRPATTAPSSAYIVPPEEPAPLTVEEPAGSVIPRQGSGQVGDLLSLDTARDRSVIGGGDDDSPPAQAVRPADDESFATEKSSAAPIDLQKEWPRFLEVLIHDRPNLGSFLSLGYVAAASQGVVEVRFQNTYRFQYTDVVRKENREIIDHKLNEFAGRPVDLHITIEAHATDARTPEHHRQLTGAPPSIEDEIEKEPVIRSVIDLFEGEVIG